MPVHLDDEGRAIAWGESIEGEDIPHPPTPASAHVWDHRAKEWVEDGEFDGRDWRERADERLGMVESALGVGGKAPEKGIAQRLDDLEERIEALEE